MPAMAQPLPAHGSGAPGVVFIHPDGTGLQAWNAYRFLAAGPDGLINWDRLPRVGLYRGHVRDSLAATSHAGATIHAYGVKVVRDSFGMDGDQPLLARSGFAGSVMQEARAAGIAIGIINSGHLAEPGTAAFLASVTARSDTTAIVHQIINSGAEVILGGGENLFLPQGVAGRHGGTGLREDGLDLIAQARAAGYAVVFTKAELEALPPDTARVLGLFAAMDTYHDRPEEELRAQGLPLYEPEAPTVAEMTAVALRLLEHRSRGFFLMVEEEGTDNFGNNNNAAGVMEAFRRADATIGVALELLARRPATLVLTAADSDASGLAVQPHGLHDPASAKPLPPTTDRNAPLDGVDGGGSMPFVSAPDRAGRRHEFGISWASSADLPGGVVARAAGLNADRLPVVLDNTGIYALIYETLFGRSPSP